MKIVLVSARLSSSIACEHGIHKALIGMGHQVVDLDFRGNSSLINKTLPALEADLLIAWKGSSLDPDVVNDLEFPTVLWYPDDWMMEHTKRDINQLGMAFDQVYTPIKTDVNRFKGMGINAAWLPPGVDVGVFKKIPGVVKEYNVTTYGARYVGREKLLKELWHAKLEPKCGEGMTHEEINVNCNMSKIVFNQSVNPGCGSQLRVFEAMASGTMLLNEKNAELAELFTDKKHLVFYDNDLVEKTLYYLNNDNKREEIAETGRKEVIRNHTWEKRLQKIIDHVLGR